MPQETNKDNHFDQYYNYKGKEYAVFRQDGDFDLYQRIESGEYQLKLHLYLQENAEAQLGTDAQGKFGIFLSDNYLSKEFFGLEPFIN